MDSLKIESYWISKTSKEFGREGLRGYANSRGGWLGMNEAQTKNLLLTRSRQERPFARKGFQKTTPYSKRGLISEITKYWNNGQILNFWCNV